MSKKKKVIPQKTDTTAQKNKAEKREEKKAAVLGTEKKGHLPLYLGIACAALIAGFVFIYFTGMDSKSSVATAQNASSGPVTQVAYPVSLFEDGNARHFKYQDGSMTINYFILKSSDGIIRAAFDACDVCWPAGKGYFQKGDVMVCRNCGRQFASVKVNEVKGGCNPAPLKRAVVGDQLVIQVSDILEGRTYFDFSRGT